MTSIQFIPTPDVSGEESGEFRLNATACLDYLRKQVDLYALPLDVLLLKWTEEAQSGSVIPDKFGERARFMLTELIDGESELNVFCRTCGESFLRESLTKQRWDDSCEVHGLHVGTAGYQIDCPNGHCLILICDRVY
jgi:hypothetical protein